jgi:hypothetical protein
MKQKTGRQRKENSKGEGVQTRTTKKLILTEGLDCLPKQAKGRKDAVCEPRIQKSPNGS